MNRNQIRLTESELKKIIKESVSKVLGEAKKKEDPMLQYFRDMEVKRFNKNSDKRVDEAYSKYNELQRLAYENQEMRPMIKKVAEFAKDAALISKMRGNDNYYRFYSKLNDDILQLDFLWDFMDNVDEP